MSRARSVPSTKPIVLRLTPTKRRELPNAASTDVARVLRAHGYTFDALQLLDSLRSVIGTTDTDDTRQLSAGVARSENLRPAFCAPHQSPRPALKGAQILAGKAPRRSAVHEVARPATASGKNARPKGRKA